jgi:hypothetical protein
MIEEEGAGRYTAGGPRIGLLNAACPSSRRKPRTVDANLELSADLRDYGTVL